MSQLRTVQVLGGGAGSSAHVTSLAAGLVARGVQVTVCAPAGAARCHDFPGTGARFVAVPRRSDPAAVAALRAACADADVVHAHGLHAAVRTGLALSGRSTPLVVTWRARAHAEGARGRLLHLMERRAARAAAVVLGTSSDLVDRARRRGARDARLAPAAIPAGTPFTGHDGKARVELGAVGRPLLVSVGSLLPHHGFGTLLDAARAWCELDPAPLLVIVGEGRERAALQRRITDERLPVLLAGRRDDVGEIIAAADLAVLTCGGEVPPPTTAHEALRLGVPLVVAGTGGPAELVGDAAEAVPHGDAEALAGAVVRLLGDRAARERLAAAGLAQAAGWPTEDDTIAHVLSVYDELAQPLATVRK